MVTVLWWYDDLWGSKSKVWCQCWGPSSTTPLPVAMCLMSSLMTWMNQFRLAWGSCEMCKCVLRGVKIAWLRLWLYSILMWTPLLRNLNSIIFRWLTDSAECLFLSLATCCIVNNSWNHSPHPHNCNQITNSPFKIHLATYSNNETVIYNSSLNVFQATTHKISSILMSILCLLWKKSDSVSDLNDAASFQTMLRKQHKRREQKEEKHSNHTSCLVVIEPSLFHQDFVKRSCLCQTTWQLKIVFDFLTMIACS